jgi:hypothetical protein
MGKFRGMKTTDGVSGVVFMYDLSDSDFENTIEELKKTYAMGDFTYHNHQTNCIWNTFTGVDVKYTTFNEPDEASDTLYLINANQLCYHFPTEDRGMVNADDEEYDQR